MRTAATLAALMTFALAACGNPDTPGGRIADQRHENFEEIGDAFKVISDQVQKAAPDVPAIQAAAATINGFAPKIETWFPAGSSPADGIKTDALPSIWQKTAEFKAAAAAFVKEAAAFNALAQAGDPAAIAGGMKALGGACKGCHDKFREKE